MQAIKFFALLAGISSAAGCISSAAEGAGAGAGSAPTMTAEVRQESGPRQLPAQRAYLAVGTNRFAFLVPDGFRADFSQPQRLQLLSADYTSLLSVRISDVVAVGEPDPNVCRQMLLARHPGAKILEQFSRIVAGRRGPAFDLEWSAPGGLVRSERIEFIPSNAGVFEICVVSSPERFAAGQQALNTVLLTFQASDAKGQLKVVPLPDRI
jgi:hypothetical protein